MACGAKLFLALLQCALQSSLGVGVARPWRLATTVAPEAPLQPEAQPRLHRCVEEYAAALDRVRPGMGTAIRSHPLTAKKTSPRGLLIGAGSGTTGHRTLATALRLLNVSSSYFALASWKNKYFRTLDLSGGSPTCQSTLRSYDYTRVPKNADAIFDTPVAELFVDFFLAFPEAKVLLTTRPGADWAAQRVQKDFGMASPLPVQEPCGKFVRSFSKNLTELAAFYDLNNQFVRCLVPPERLFEVNLWEDPPGQMRSLVRRLGEFLGRPAAEGLQMPKHLKFAKMDENPDWPGNACDSASAQPEPLALAEGRAQESLWTERFGGMMQTLARQECDIVL